MRILLTIRSPLDADAGAPGAVMQLASECRRTGHEVHILSLDDFSSQVPPRLQPVLFPWLVLRRVRQMANQLDVVDASSGDSWLYTRRQHDPMLRRMLWVTHNHGLEHTVHRQILQDARAGNLKLSWKYPIYNGGFRLWAAARSYQQADLCLFLNKPDLRYAVTKLHVPKERARITTNGLPKGFLGLPFEATPSDPRTDLGIVQLGYYCQRKGVDYGNAALCSLMKDYPGVRVSFLGTRCAVERVLQDFDSDLRHRVHVIPHFCHLDLPSLLRGHQIKLLPTLAEGLPMALLEAMSCGLAAVTTDVPGPSEIVDADVEGVIVEPRSANAIEKALRRLIENRLLLDRMRRNAHQRAQQYSWAKVAAGRVAMYEEFIATKRALLSGGGFSDQLGLLSRQPGRI